MGITCCRIAIAKDGATEAEYLVCSNVFPAPELAKEALQRGRKGTSGKKPRWADWDAALAKISNMAVVEYYKKELAAGREKYLRKRILIYRIADKRKWFVAARNKNAYVWQYQRFEGDEDFWRTRLSDPNGVKPVKNGACLRLFLETPNDFSFFHQSAIVTLQNKEWLGAGSVEDGDTDVDPE